VTAKAHPDFWYDGSTASISFSYII